MESKNSHHHSRFKDRGPSIAEKVIKFVINILEKPISLKGNADCLSELPSLIGKLNNTIHSSIKMTPVQARKQSNEKEVHSILQDRRVRKQPKFNLGQLVRTADIKGVFGKGDSTNYSYKLYTINEIVYDSIASYRKNNLPERYN